MILYKERLLNKFHLESPQLKWEGKAASFGILILVVLKVVLRTALVKKPYLPQNRLVQFNYMNQLLGVFKNPKEATKNSKQA